MALRWHCHEIFQRMPSGVTAGGIAIVIDVLRASTTMITALDRGAVRVIPVADVEEARRIASEIAGGVVLGGERGGVRIPGFDLGNSPLEYSADRVAGRTVVITTTNGTAALHASSGAAEIVVGGIVNRTAVAETVRGLARGRAAVHLVCAGTDGAVSAEDLLAAGAILDAASHECQDDEFDAAARGALALFRDLVALGDVSERLVEEFRRSPGGSNLVALGMENDLTVAAAIDSYAVVPRLDRASGSLI